MLRDIIIEDLIELTLSKEKNERVQALEELRNRVNEDPYCLTHELSLKFFNSIGKMALGNPESYLVQTICSKLKDSHDLDSVPITQWLESNKWELVHLAIGIIKSLKQCNRERLVLPLVKGLMKQDALNTNIYGSLRDALIEINGEIVVNALKPYLTDVTWKVVGPVEIISCIGDESVAEDLINVLNKTLEGYYESESPRIQTDIARFFKRTRTPKGVLPLLRVLPHAHQPNEIADALSSIGKPGLNPILEFMDKCRTQEGILNWLLVAISQMDQETIRTLDFKNLLEIAHPSPSKFIGQEALMRIAQKLDESVENSLSDMLKSKTRDEYIFAKECLTRRGKTIPEILSQNPILSVYKFFYKRKGELEKILLDANITKNNLKQKQNFEHGIESLLSTCGFITLWVDPAGIKGVDIVAFSSPPDYILIIGCTTGALVGDIEKLYETSQRLKKQMTDYRILPFIFSSAKSDEISNKEEALRKGIGVLSSDEIENVLDMSKHARPHKEILNYIIGLTAKIASDS